MDLGATLAQSARRWPGRTALVAGDRRWTYDAWNREVNRLAHGFAACGIGPGDRVAVLSNNTPEEVSSFYAALKLGAVPVPINYRLAPTEVRHVLDDSSARMLVFEEALRSPVAAIAGDLATVETLVYVGNAPERNEIPYARLLAGGAEDEPAARIDGDDPAFIMYTSGTTGLPKGVVRTHRAELVGALVRATECGFRHDDVVIDNSPLFHIGQLQLQLIPFVMLGGTNVLTRGFDVEETLEVCASERVTVLHGVPTQLVMLADADRSGHDLGALRVGFFGGGTLPDDVVGRSLEWFPDYFANLYGSTEALVVTVCDYRRHPDRIGSAGKAAHLMEARIVDAESSDPQHPLPAGEVGALVARGPTLMRGYHGLPERTAQALRGGWYHTGDAARADDDGFITVLGRLDDTVKTGGENVHPSEIENVLFAHPGIANAAVVGLPSRRWGQVVAAAVVRADPRLTDEAIDRFCREAPGLADFKRPRRYVFLDEIPSSPTGKVERARIAALMTERLGPLD